MHNRFDYRLRLVQTARQQGIKAAARLFQTTVPTVRKWLRRYQQKGLSGLQEQSRAPHHCPHQIARPIERQVWALRRQLPTFGAARLKREFDLAPSHTAIQRHLDRYGIDLRHLVWQTDNGSEFIGGHDSLGHPTGFPASLGDSQHQRIPPAAHTYQSDVETVHRLIEDEFFDLESFRNRPDFFAKATLYQLYFNLACPNSHKHNCTPWQIIEQLAPQSPLDLCLLPPLNLDYFLNQQGGYDLPLHPYFCCSEQPSDQPITK